MRPGAGDYNTLTPPAHASANAVVRAGRWLLPVACVFVFSTALVFAAAQAVLTEQATVTSAEARSITSSDRVTAPAPWDDPRHCPQTVDQADIDFYLLTVSKDQQQLRANAVALCQLSIEISSAP